VIRVLNTDKNNLKETVDRGNTVIPLYIYHEYANKYALYLHWHNEVEIIYVEKGSLVFTVDTVPHTVSAGQCIIINSGQLHSAAFTNNEPTIHHALLFDINFLSSSSFDYCQSTYIDPLLNGQYRFPTVIDENSIWGATIIDEVKDAFNIIDSKSFGFELGIKAFLYKIISILAKENNFLIDEAASKSSINYKINVIKKALNYIQDNFSKKIYTEDLAKEVNMNPQYFCRFFKATIGKTPVEFINQYRIEQAAKLINIEDKKISDIYLEVGFDNFSYFIKKFKQYKKCTPRKYKEKKL
jgi:AraC-like DNA-binding protein